MKDKLTYIHTSDVTIDIDLKNGYSVRTDAKFNYDTGRYDATFYLKENTIDKYVAINDLNNEEISFDGNKKKIKVAILKYVSWLLNMNKFEKIIREYEYEVKCFDKGYDFFEEERIYGVYNAK